MAERPFAFCRRSAGLELWQAAVRLRVSERYLRSLELGNGPLSMVLAGKMAAAYGVTVDELVRPAAESANLGRGRGPTGRRPVPGRVV